MLSYHFLYFSGNCSICQCKCVNITTVNIKLPCADFCRCGPTCENMDFDPIQNDFPGDDDGKVSNDLDIYLSHDFFKVLLYFETHFFLFFTFVQYSLHLDRSRNT